MRTFPLHFRRPRAVPDPKTIDFSLQSSLVESPGRWNAKQTTSAARG